MLLGLTRRRVYAVRPPLCRPEAPTIPDFPRTLEGIAVYAMTASALAQSEVLKSTRSSAMVAPPGGAQGLCGRGDNEHLYAACG